MTYLMTALVVGAVLEVGVTWWLLRGLRRLDQVDARIGHLTEALRLLAETTEAGFRASATELARIAEAAATDGAKQGAAAPADRTPKASIRAASVKKTSGRLGAAASVNHGETSATRSSRVPPPPASEPRASEQAPVSAAAHPAPARAARQAAGPRKRRAAVPVVTEAMSESEARLRLLLAEKTAADHAAREAARGALRA